MLEPVTDMFDEPDEVVVLFEVPGVARKDIHCVLDGDILLLEAKTRERLYRKEILIEPRLAEEAPRLRLRNGVLEARLAKPA
jgi:HSP20 family protein